MAGTLGYRPALSASPSAPSFATRYPIASQTTTRRPFHPEQRPIWIYNVTTRAVLGVWKAWSGCIVHCRRSITADTALGIGRALGMTLDYWLNLQRMYDLDVARSKTEVSTIEPLEDVSALRVVRGANV